MAQNESWNEAWRAVLAEVEARVPPGTMDMVRKNNDGLTKLPWGACSLPSLSEEETCFWDGLEVKTSDSDMVFVLKTRNIPPGGEWKFERLPEKENAFYLYIPPDNINSCLTLPPDALAIVAAVLNMGHANWWNRPRHKALQCSGGATSAVFSPDGETIAGGVHNDVCLWIVETGMCIFTLQGHRLAVTSVAFSPDGTRVVSGSVDGDVKVWRLDTKECVMTLRRHNDVVASIAFSPKGKRIVSGSYDGTIRVWNAETGRCKRVFLDGRWVFSVAYSPDGKRIVSGSSNGTVRVWSTKSGRRKRTIQNHSNVVSSVAFSPDGTRIVSGSYDKTVRVYNADTSMCERTFCHLSPVISVAYSPDGTHIASGSDDGVKVWDAITESAEYKQMSRNQTVMSVAYSLDGEWIVGVLFDKTVRVWPI